MDYPKFIAWNQKEDSISIQRDFRLDFFMEGTNMNPD